MAVKFISVKCPECGASLPIEEGREKMFCSYCGVPVVMTNENEHIYRHVDEAKIKQAEVNRVVQLKKLEIIEQKRKDAQRIRKIKTICSIVMGIIAVLFMMIGSETSGMIGLLLFVAIMYIWIMGDTGKDDDIDLDDKVKVPAGISHYEKQTYKSIESMFIGAGFTNVKCVPMNDLTTGWLKKPNTVDSITIMGSKVSSGGKKYLPDVPVIISYHSFTQFKGED